MKKIKYQARLERFKSGDLSQAEFYKIKGLLCLLNQGYSDIKLLLNCNNKRLAAALLDHVVVQYLMDDGHESK